MKYLSKTLFFALMLLSNVMAGQEKNSISFKVQAISLLKNGVEIVSEWQINPRTSLEVSFRYNQIGSRPDGVFHGTWSNQYVERRTYLTDQNATAVFNDAGWEYLGDGRPMPPISGLLTSLSSGRVSAGFRRYNTSGDKKLRYFIQPSVSVAFVELFEVIKNDTYIQETQESWRLGELSQPSMIAIRETRDVNQFRETHFTKNWIVGASYHLGVQYQLKKRFLLEAKIGGGFNLGGLPDLAKKLPLDLRQYYGNAQFLVGYRFG